MLNVLRLKNLHQFTSEIFAGRVTEAHLARKNNAADFLNNTDFYEELKKLNK